MPEVSGTTRPVDDAALRERRDARRPPLPCMRATGRASRRTHCRAASAPRSGLLRQRLPRPAERAARRKISARRLLPARKAPRDGARRNCRPAGSDSREFARAAARSRELERIGQIFGHRSAMIGISPSSSASRSVRAQRPSVAARLSAASSSRSVIAQKSRGAAAGARRSELHQRGPGKCCRGHSRPDSGANVAVSRRTTISQVSRRRRPATVIVATSSSRNVVAGAAQAGADDADAHRSRRCALTSKRSASASRSSPPISRLELGQRAERQTQTSCVLPPSSAVDLAAMQDCATVTRRLEGELSRRAIPSASSKVDLAIMARRRIRAR